MAQEVRPIALEGATLSYSVHGEGSGKPPLIFVHGYAMRATGPLYDELLGLLARRFTVYAVDLRGQGASGGEKDWSFEACADDLAAVSRALKLERPGLIGHSLGGVVTLLAAIRHPGAFSSVCLLSPGPADHRRDPPDTLDVLIENGRDRDKLRDGFRRMFVHDPGAKLEQVLDAVILVDPEVHRAQKAEDPHFSIDDQLKDIAQPVLLVCGACDTVVPPERQHDMARKLPHAKEVVFSGEGHMLAIERPAVAAREITGFLEADSPMPVDVAG